MASGIFDDALLKHLWSTDELRAIFCDTNRVQKWYDFEAALALEQAKSASSRARRRATLRPTRRSARWISRPSPPKSAASSIRWT